MEGQCNIKYGQIDILYPQMSILHYRIWTGAFIKVAERERERYDAQCLHTLTVLTYFTLIVVSLH